MSAERTMASSLTTAGGEAPDSDSDTALSGLSSLAERLDYCIRTMHAPDRGPWTLQEVADGTAAITDKGSWSQGYLSKVRAGKVTNPSSLHIQTLARFFRIPVDYFVATDQEVARILEDRAIAQAAANPQVREIVAYAATLDPVRLRLLSALIDQTIAFLRH